MGSRPRHLEQRIDGVGLYREIKRDSVGMGMPIRWRRFVHGGRAGVVRQRRAECRSCHPGPYKQPECSTSTLCDRRECCTSVLYRLCVFVSTLLMLCKVLLYFLHYGTTSTNNGRGNGRCCDECGCRTRGIGA